MIDYFKLATDICRKDAERLRREADGRIATRAYFPLDRATVCLDCSAVSSLGLACPNCASEHLMPLGRWLDSVPNVPGAGKNAPDEVTP